jgi:hypothetical protein
VGKETSIPTSRVRPSITWGHRALELAVLFIGVVFSLDLAIEPDATFGLERRPIYVSVLIFVTGFLLTVLVFLVVHRRTPPSKIEHDAARYLLARAKGESRPARPQVSRIALRALLCFPSLIALVTLFFFPAASHLIRLRQRQRVGPYGIDIPWSLVMIPMPEVPADRFITAFALAGSGGHFRLSSFWRTEMFSSEMGFGSVESADSTADVRARYQSREFEGARALTQRDLRVGALILTCWQFLPPSVGWRHGSPGERGDLWQVHCETPVGLRGNHFYAWFNGQDADLPAFYGIVERVQPLP